MISPGSYEIVDKNNYNLEWPFNSCCIKTMINVLGHPLQTNFIYFFTSRYEETIIKLTHFIFTGLNTIILLLKSILYSKPMIFVFFETIKLSLSVANSFNVFTNPLTADGIK